MATLEEALHAKLAATSGVTSLCPASRIYLSIAPENATFPHVTFQRITTVRNNVLQPTVQSGFATVLVQIDTWNDKAGNIYGAKAIADAIRLALDAFRGTVSGVDVQGILAENEVTQWEPDTETWRIRQEYRVFVKE